MRIGTVILGVLITGLGHLASTQHTTVKNTNPFAGDWTYRSFRNVPEPVGDVSTDPSKLVKMLFAEAEWVVQDTSDGSFKGELRFGPQDVMDLTGAITPETSTCPAKFHISGKGRPGTSTSQLFYD